MSKFHTLHLRWLSEIILTLTNNELADALVHSEFVKQASASERSLLMEMLKRLHQVEEPPKTWTEETIEWAQGCFWRYVDEHYDDPSEIGTCAEDYRIWLHETEELAEQLGVDFNDVVRETTTEFERSRMNDLCDEVNWEK